MASTGRVGGSGVAVFLDRDGVISEERSDYVKSWREFRFLPGALEATAALARAGLRLFVVTNQSAIHRGLVSWEDVEEIHRRMVEEIVRAGGAVEAQALHVFGRAEALVASEAETGIALPQAFHEIIPGHLGYQGSSGHGEAGGIFRHLRRT